VCVILIYVFGASPDAAAVIAFIGFFAIVGIIATRANARDRQRQRETVEEFERQHPAYRIPPDER
jgi:hypothetical protein